MTSASVRAVGRIGAARRRVWPAWLCLAAWVSAHGAVTDPVLPDPVLTDPMPLDADARPQAIITGRGRQLIGVADSATEGVVRAEQLAHRPLLRPAEVMEAVPGLTVTQHSGDGKANQYFLRGFNLDHGSDFASFIEGMPVNMVSHAHGQGYMDLNFLIPEVVGAMRYRKGVYAAEDGDFATTGSARISLARSLPAAFIEQGGGPHAYRRTLAAGSTPVSAAAHAPVLLGALELASNNGPWEQPEGLRKRNAVLRLSDGVGRDGWSVTAMAYDAHWTATEHVPERAVLSGEIGRYGASAAGDGGRTHRHSLSGDWSASDGDARTQAGLYLIDYGLNLFSNPSGQIRGAQGDQHEQADQRIVWGGQWTRQWTLDTPRHDTELNLGLQWRQDRIATLGLYDTVNRQRTDTVREDRLRQTQLGLYGEARTRWQHWLRSTVGLRLDAVRGQVTPTGGALNTANGGTAQGRQLSPRLGLVIGPLDPPLIPARSEFYVNWGQGFHSNDLRGATSTVNARDGSAIAKVPPLVRASGGELGLRTQPLPGWTSHLSLWRMNLNSELVFVGDEGVTEPRGASHRIGLEWSNDWQVNRWLLLDADLAWARARFREPVQGGTQVPNAIPLSASWAAVADDHGAWFAGLRWRYVGAYALEETGTQRSRAFWTANLRLGWRPSAQWQLTLDVLNLFNRQAHDIEYWGAACTRSEGPACQGGAGIDGRLVHPMEPRTLRLALRAQL